MNWTWFRKNERSVGVGCFTPKSSVDGATTDAKFVSALSSGSGRETSAIGDDNNNDTHSTHRVLLLLWLTTSINVWVRERERERERERKRTR